ncbi:MAG: AMP-binding protein [Deltaproteobacteria bacterium]|nr:AMP-binding protein [Deltaproteobacteria bacterium]
MPTIALALKEMAETFPENDAVVHCQRRVRWSYAAFFKLVQQAALGLQQHGIGRGAHVGIWGRNCPEWLVSQYALSLLGAVWIPIDPGCRANDLAYMLDHSDATALIMPDEFRPVLWAAQNHSKDADSLRSLARVFVWTEGEAQPGEIAWSELIQGDQRVDQGWVDDLLDQVSPEDVVSIMYTSGTTGQPKGVMLNHRTLIERSIAATMRQRITSRDRLALFFPLYHMFGNTCISLSGIIRGASLVIPSDAFDPHLILSALAAEKCTAVYAAPSMIVALMNEPDFTGYDLTALRTGAVGGAPCPLELMKKIVHDLGVKEITLGYGLTEASSWIAMTHPDDPLDLRVATVGTPLPGCEIKAIDPVTDQAVPRGIPGEICTRGSVMLGYYKSPQLTAQVVDEDGWYHTGDLGVIDDRGYIRITGRIKDVVVKDGREIYPTDIENVLYRLPQVAEAQVFGVPHPVRGMLLSVWIKPKPGNVITIEGTLNFLRSELGEEHLPDLIKVVTSFPATRSGKIQKFRMIEMTLAELRE